MKPAVKSSLIIALTLLIGVVIGFEISEISVKRYMDVMRRPRQPERFLEMFEKVIKPDEKQKPVVDSILMRYHTKLDVLAQANMTQVRGVIDSMQAELKTKLNSEQVKRLDEEMLRMRRNGPQFRGRKDFPPPPPPGGGPGPFGGRPEGPEPGFDPGR